MNRRADPNRDALVEQVCRREYRWIVEIESVQDLQLPNVLGHPPMFPIGLQNRQCRYPQPGLRLEVRPMDQRRDLPVPGKRQQGRRIEHQVVKDHAAAPFAGRNASRRRAPIAELSSSDTSTPKCSAR